MTSEIRYLHMKIAMLNDSISDKSSDEDSEAETASGSGSEDDSSSSSSDEEPELKHNIRFRGRRYVMN